MRIFRIALPMLMMVGLAGMAHAQWAAYGMFTGSKLDTAGTSWLYGGTVGIYRDHRHGLIATGFDVRGEFVRRSHISMNSGLGGLRLAITPRVLPLKPYVEGLVGVGYIGEGQGSGRTSSTEFAIQGFGWGGLHVLSEAGLESGGVWLWWTDRRCFGDKPNDAELGAGVSAAVLGLKFAR